MRTFTSPGPGGNKPHTAAAVSSGVSFPRKRESNRIRFTGILFTVILFVITFYLVAKKNQTSDTNPVWIGIQILTIDDTVSKDYNLIYKHGLLVRNVISGSPADDAGIMKDDIIRIVDGQTIIDTSQLKKIISGKSPGQKIRIVYIRDKITKTTYAIAEEAPGIDPNTRLVYGTYPAAAPDPAVAPDTVIKKNQTPGTNPVWIGVQVVPIDDKISKNLNLTFNRGLLVRNVIAGSPADDAGILKDDIIRRIGVNELVNTAQLKTYLSKKSPGQKIRIVYIRDGITATTDVITEEASGIDPNTRLVYGAYPVVAPPTNKPYPYFYFGEEYDPPENE